MGLFKRGLNAFSEEFFGASLDGTPTNHEWRICALCGDPYRIYKTITFVKTLYEGAINRALYNSFKGYQKPTVYDICTRCFSNAMGLASSIHNHKDEQNKL